MHLVYKFCLTIVFYSCRDDCNTHEKLKTKCKILRGTQGALWSQWKWWIDRTAVEIKSVWTFPVVYATSTFPIKHLICPPPPQKKKLRNPFFFSFPLGITFVPRAIKNKVYAKCLGDNKVHCGKGGSGVFLVKLTTLPSHPKQSWILSKMDGKEWLFDHNIAGGGGVSGGTTGWTQSQKIVIRSRVLCNIYLERLFHTVPSSFVLQVSCLNPIK